MRTDLRGDVRGMCVGCAWDVRGMYAGCTRDLREIAREIAREMRVRFFWGFHATPPLYHYPTDEVELSGCGRVNERTRRVLAMCVVFFF